MVEYLSTIGLASAVIAIGLLVARRFVLKRLREPMVIVKVKPLRMNVIHCMWCGMLKTFPGNEMFSGCSFIFNGCHKCNDRFGELINMREMSDGANRE